MLFVIILIEGYVVLACELLAIRQLIPFVGSGTDTIAIIISGVLLPLAIGYHAGGNAYKNSYARARAKGRKALSVRKLLLRNIVAALAILIVSLSYPFLELFFRLMQRIGIEHRLLQTGIYALLFLVVPVFLLAQTVPLVSNYFSRRHLSEITGKMLFFSTAGSFLGSVFSTVVLMTYIGVHNTVIVTLGLLCLLAVLLARSMWSYQSAFIGCLLVVLVVVNGPTMMQRLHIVSNNAYSMVTLIDLPKEEAKILNINRSPSSKVSKDPHKNFLYWKYIDHTFIAPISTPGMAARDMLIIGAGGFTIGLNDKVNNYTFVDIDRSLKDVSERYFLPEKLSANKRFVASSARAFVHSDTKQYDFILIDAYTNMLSIPMECTTREFLVDVKNRLKPGGIVIANFLGSATFRDKLTVRYDNTFASVFPGFSRQVISEFNAWEGTMPVAEDPSPANILYVYYNNALIGDPTVYTDDKNTYSLDRY